MTPRTLLPLFLGAFVSAALAKDAPLLAGLIDAHGEHVVLVAGTLSADGRYAGGWTVSPKKGKPPVKWNTYGKEDSSFVDDYCDPETGAVGYTVQDVVVDLSSKTVVARLNFTEPYYMSKGHGALEVAYGPEGNGHRFAVALSDGKWATLDMALVDLSDGGQTDLLKPANAAVANGIGKQTRKSTKGFATDYQVFSLPETGLFTGFSDAETLRIPFNSEVPKGESGAFAGTVLVRLSPGKDHPVATMGEVHFTKEDPDPGKDDPRLAAADKELNEAYAAAKSHLDAAGKARLVNEQRAWLKDRDNQVGSVQSTMDDQALANPRFVKDQLLLKLTKDRTEVLRHP